MQLKLKLQLYLLFSQLPTFSHQLARFFSLTNFLSFHTNTQGGSVNARGGDIEAPSPAQPDVMPAADPEMDKFFAQVAQIKGHLADIRNHHNTLEDAHERSKTVTRSADMHVLRGQMQHEANAISKAADQIKRLLQDLDKSNEAALKKKISGPGTASERTRTAVTAALKKKLKEIMGEFQSLRTRVQREYREVVERRVYTVTGQHASDDEIDRMIENGEAESVFQRAILEQGRGYVMDTLAEIRERRDAVMELEASLMELHQIFLDMAVLVEAQGQMIDNIEAQVSSF
jgi:syntaxin 1B/2/3